MGTQYQVTGLNLKASPLGESDRLMTILSPERGLIRAIAPGVRKTRSTLGGRMGLFLVNTLLIQSGRTLHRIVQAETQVSYPGLAQSFLKLTAAQYLVEIALAQSLEEHPQSDLFNLLQEHLKRLELAPEPTILARLSQGIFHLLALAGCAPQVHYCSRTHQLLVPNFHDRHWRAGFSVTGGRVLSLNLEQGEPPRGQQPDRGRSNPDPQTGFKHDRPSTVQPLTAQDLHLLQQLAQADLPPALQTLGNTNPSPWLRVEGILRRYTQYHLDIPLRSASLLDWDPTLNRPPDLPQGS